MCSVWYSSTGLLLVFLCQNLGLFVRTISPQLTAVTTYLCFGLKPWLECINQQLELVCIRIPAFIIRDNCAYFCLIICLLLLLLFSCHHHHWIWRFFFFFFGCCPKHFNVLFGLFFFSTLSAQNGRENSTQPLSQVFLVSEDQREFSTLENPIKVLWEKPK